MSQVTIGTSSSGWMRSRSSSSMNTAWNGNNETLNSGINLDSYAPIGAQGKSVNGSYWKACQSGGFVPLADLPKGAIIDNIAATYYIGSDDSDANFYLQLYSVDFATYYSAYWQDWYELSLLEDADPPLMLASDYAAGFSTGSFNVLNVNQAAFKAELEAYNNADETNWSYIYAHDGNRDLATVNTNDNEIVQIYDLVASYHLKLVIDYHMPSPHAIMNGVLF